MTYKPAKYPISDTEMLELLHKYPFLRFRNVFSKEQSYQGKSQNLKNNYYKYWDGSGWEGLWKRYLKKLFAVYDKLPKQDQKMFQFLEVKEKFGEMRIYCSGATSDCEQVAEWLSNYTCEYCGAEPRDEHGKRMIYTSDGWITHMCKDCAIEYLKREGVKEEDIDKALEEMKEVDPVFGYKTFGNDKITRTTYKETEDGEWLVKDSVVELDKDEERRQMIAGLKGE